MLWTIIRKATPWAALVLLFSVAVFAVGGSSPFWEEILKTYVGAFEEWLDAHVQFPGLLGLTVGIALCVLAWWISTLLEEGERGWLDSLNDLRERGTTIQNHGWALHEQSELDKFYADVEAWWPDAANAIARKRPATARQFKTLGTYIPRQLSRPNPWLSKQHPKVLQEHIERLVRLEVIINENKGQL